MKITRRKFLKFLGMGAAAAAVPAVASKPRNDGLALENVSTATNGESESITLEKLLEAKRLLEDNQRMVYFQNRAFLYEPSVTNVIDYSHELSASDWEAMGISGTENTATIITDTESWFKPISDYDPLRRKFDRRTYRTHDGKDIVVNVGERSVAEEARGKAWLESVLKEA